MRRVRREAIDGCGLRGMWVDEAVRWIDRGGDRPTALVARVVTVNGEPVETLVPEPVAGIGGDGRYHGGRLLDPRVVARAEALTDVAMMRRAGVTIREDR